MINPDKIVKIIRYLVDLDEMLTEHDKPDYMCGSCDNLRKSGHTGGCYYKATISVEIVTNQRKLLEYAKIV